MLDDCAVVQRRGWADILDEESGHFLFGKGGLRFVGMGTWVLSKVVGSLGRNLLVFGDTKGGKVRVLSLITLCRCGFPTRIWGRL